MMDDVITSYKKIFIGFSLAFHWIFIGFSLDFQIVSLLLLPKEQVVAPRQCTAVPGFPFSPPETFQHFLSFKWFFFSFVLPVSSSIMEGGWGVSLFGPVAFFCQEF